MALYYSIYFRNMDIFGYPISMNYNYETGGINDKML
jgi:hypothetical protein